MSKNVRIKEGNVVKPFNGVKKVRLHNQDGSTSLWVPEDETKLGTKTINANGTYVASEEIDEETHESKGWYGYEEVTVNMNSRLGTKSISSEGTFKASDEIDEETHESKGWYGYSQVTVNMGSKLGAKRIDAEGTYNASDEIDEETHQPKGWLGYSQVTVSMSSRLGTKTIKEDGTYRAEDEVDEETHQSKGWYGYSQVTVHGKGKGTYTAKEGDRIDGQDLIPDEDYMFGKSEPWGDDDGEGEGGGDDTMTLLPYKIRITQKPTKYEYIHGEDIDIAGIVVKAYKKDNSLWTDATHPDGILSLDELGFAPTKADLNQVSRIDYTDEDGLNATKMTIQMQLIKQVGGGAQDGAEERYVFPKPLWIHHSDNDGDTEGYLDFGSGGEYLVTRYNDTLYIHGISGSDYQTVRWWRISEYSNKWITIYMGTSGRVSFTKFASATQPNLPLDNWDLHPNIITWIPRSTKDPTLLTKEQIDNLLEVGGKQTISIIYEREDGKKLKDTFDIDVDINPDNPIAEGGGGGHDF